MVISGPWLRRVWITIQMPRTRATIGTSQMAEMRRRSLTVALASVIAFPELVPDEPRVEGVGGEHGDDHDPAEGQRRRTGSESREGRPDWISATRIDTTKTSVMDHLPTSSAAR